MHSCQLGAQPKGYQSKPNSSSTIKVHIQLVGILPPLTRHAGGGEGVKLVIMDMILVHGARRKPG